MLLFVLLNDGAKVQKKTNYQTFLKKKCKKNYFRLRLRGYDNKNRRYPQRDNGDFQSY